jgi:hypothetical protein
MEMVSINFQNIIKIIRAIFEKTAIFVLGPIWGASVFIAGMFLFTRHQPMLDEPLNAEYE